MDNSHTIACVTGASGMIGRRIVSRLIDAGYTVRALTRNPARVDARAGVYQGSLEDAAVLASFLDDVDILFHCAAELNDENCMRRTNVTGTRQILDMVRGSGVRYFCYVSSAGVVGATDACMVDEHAACSPQNEYERTKLEAEELVRKGIDGCKTVVLRPTNVIDEKKPGALGSLLGQSLINRFRVFVKGGECAHIVHARDVADAAMYFISQDVDGPACFFISCDEHPLNTFAGLWALCRAVETNSALEMVKPVYHLPLVIPFFLRRLWRGKGNRGDVRYSSQNLKKYGYTPSLGVAGAVRHVIQFHESIKR